LKTDATCNDFMSQELIQSELFLKLTGTETKESQNWSSPRKGVSLANATALRGKAVRDAVTILSNEFQKEQVAQVFPVLFLPRIQPIISASCSEPISVRIAWNLVGIWLIARASDTSATNLSIAEAELWFRGNTRPHVPLLSEFISADALTEVQRQLNEINLDDEFWDLLPHMFEQHGPGSRTSVMRNPTTAIARAAKRESGVFYTPSDVADFMIQHTSKIYSGEFLKAAILDPACGTGVFLLAAFREAVIQAGNGPFHRFNYITANLHGLDISGQALDAAAFILLKECLLDVRALGMSPWSAWHLIRMNLVEHDALHIDNESDIRDSDKFSRLAEQQLILNGLRNLPSQFIPYNSLDQSSMPHSTRNDSDLFSPPIPHLSDIFPRVANGFSIVIGNPPYAALGQRSDRMSLANRYSCLEGIALGSRLNLFPLFIEMMWKLTQPQCSASALVVPLSIASGSNAQYKNCRNAISWSGGRWQFAFFDRQPHALFGEEVKTRNAILFRTENTITPPRGKPAEIETGPLRKWTSRTRKQLFQNIDFTPVDSINITNSIPKLHGLLQAKAFMTLRKRIDRLPSFCLRIGTADPLEAFEKVDRPRLFVGGTAYNFLNVYRSVNISQEEYALPFSNSAVHCLEFKSELEAQLAFAILSSRLTFWKWHILGDGFHVASWLFEEVPFGKSAFSEINLARLAKLGDQLWQKLQMHRFVSLNSGKQTIGFRPLTCHEERAEIDKILVDTAGLDKEFVDELQRFVHQNSVVDVTDERRSHVSQYFRGGTKV